MARFEPAISRFIGRHSINSATAAACRSSFPSAALSARPKRGPVPVWRVLDRPATPLHEWWIFDSRVVLKNYFLYCQSVQIICNCLVWRRRRFGCHRGLIDGRRFWKVLREFLGGVELAPERHRGSEEAISGETFTFRINRIFQDFCLHSESRNFRRPITQPLIRMALAQKVALQPTHLRRIEVKFV